MLAAAATIWILFSLWLIAPSLGVPRPLARLAMGLLCAELAVLLLWSYGTQTCLERDCAPIAQAAGIAARTDVPILAALFVLATIAQLRRGGTARG
jgi:hypothetical protein